MANITLKDIQFPGLANTYKIPEVDNTLSITGAAADAKKTGDELGNLKEDLKNNGFVRITANDLESGTFGNDGKQANGKRIRTINPFYCAEGAVLKFNIGSLFVKIFELSTNSTSGGNIIYTPAIEQLSKYTVTHDAWIMLYFGTASTVSSSSAITPSDFAGYSVYRDIDEMFDIVRNDIITDSDFINATQSFVNYGYDEPYYKSGVAGGSWKTSIGIKREKEFVTLDRSTIPSGQVFIRLSKNVMVETLNDSVDAWDAGVSLKSGHKYRAACKLLSGTSIYDEETGSLVPPLMVIKTGSHTNIAVGTVSSESCIRDFVAESGESYNLALYLYNGKYTLSNAKFVVVLEDLTESRLYSIESNINALQEKSVPDYYAAHLQDKSATIIEKGLNITNSGIRFCFITDYHTQNNARHSGSLLRRICEETGIRKVVFGGDAEQSELTPSEGYAAILNMVKDFSSVAEISDMYYITGNHEMNNPSGNTEYQDRMISEYVIGRMFADQMHHVVNLGDGNNCFYADDEFAKLRTYFIGCDSKAMISINSRRSLIDSLLTVPEGYTVLLVSHVGLVWDDDSDAVTIEWRAKNLIDCCTAMNDGTSVTINLGTESNPIMRTVDFSEKQRDFIGMLSGHNHYDAYIIHDSRFPIISTACDAYGVASVRFPPNPPMTPGTIYEQCFDVVQIDMANKRIYMTRIGSGSDRTFSYGNGSALLT